MKNKLDDAVEEILFAVYFIKTKFIQAPEWQQILLIIGYYSYIMLMLWLVLEPVPLWSMRGY